MRAISVFLVPLVIATSHATPPPSLPGITSDYSTKLENRLKSWPPAYVTATAQNPDAIHVKCIRTPGDEWYMGFQSTQWVKSSLERLAAVISDYETYSSLFPDVKAVRVLSREGPVAITSWEKTVPVPFVANEKFEIAYLAEASTPARRIFRYRLHKEGRVKKNDGMLVLDQVTPELTRLVQYSFYSAEWGAVKALGNQTIWLKNAEGLLKQAWAMALLAENPDRKPEWARKEANARTKKAKGRRDTFCDETVAQSELWQ